MPSSTSSSPPSLPPSLSPFSEENDGDDEIVNKEHYQTKVSNQEDQSARLELDEDESDENNGNGNNDDEIEDEDKSEDEGRLIQVKKRNHKRRKVIKNEFIDDEAELSGDDEVSEDELELSGDDEIDLDLVDKDAKELDSDEEEAVRGLYHKQLETEDKRAVLLLQEQLEEKEVSIGHQRRRKFRWQTKELMENSLKRHYDPDDDDSQESDDDEEDDVDFDLLQPRLRRPNAGYLLLGSARLTSKKVIDEQTVASSNSNSEGFFKAMTSAIGNKTTNPTQFSDDSNSNTVIRLTASSSSATNANVTRNGSSTTSDLNRFLFRDKEVVEALSTKETVMVTREEKDRVIQRELKRVLASKSIFDQLYN